jgi:Mrp family chromosome partitioning ATPase
VHDAPELLSSAATAQLFGEFRSRYEVIICDSPPLMAGIDPFVLSSLTGNLLLVVRTGVSQRDVLASKVELIGRMPIRLLGAVLNDVAQGSVYEYYAYYLPGYDTSDEAGVSVQSIIY